MNDEHGTPDEPHTPTSASAFAAEYARLPEPARAIATRLGMSKIPHEGPWFVETWRAEETVGGALGDRYPSPRRAGTAILALLTHESFSALHRLATDEIWHFHAGMPLELFTIAADGTATIVTLGSDILAGEKPQHVVPRGTWMAARPLTADAESWSLIGNTLAPGFEFEDYEAGERVALVAAFPANAEFIAAYTREDQPPDRSSNHP